MRFYRYYFLDTFSRRYPFFFFVAFTILQKKVLTLFESTRKFSLSFVGQKDALTRLFVTGIWFLSITKNVIATIATSTVLSEKKIDLIEDRECRRKSTVSNLVFKKMFPALQSSKTDSTTCIVFGFLINYSTLTIMDERIDFCA